MKRLLLFLLLSIVFQLSPMKVFSSSGRVLEDLNYIFIKGKILSLPNRAPIAFANIGIVNSSFGTISELDGSFTLRIPDKYLRDTILFSALGYESVKIPISELSGDKSLSIFLKETSYQLPEIVVTNDQVRSRAFTAGNSNYQGGSIYADTIGAGSAMALLINNKSRNGRVRFEYPKYVQEAQVMIANNTFEEFKVRVRLYDVEKNGEQLVPGKDILNESVIVKSAISEGWLKFDLSPYRVRIEGDFFLVFEWILDEKDRSELHYQYKRFKLENPDQVSQEYSKVQGKKIAYDNYQGNFYIGTSFGISTNASRLQAYTCYYRLNSLGAWYPAPTTLAAKVLLSNQAQFDLASGELMEEEIPELSQLPSHYYLRSLAKTDSSSLINTQKRGLLPFHKTQAEPIEISIVKENNTLRVFADNKSNYPYHLSLYFSDIVNLRPIVDLKKFVVDPGKKQLIDFEVVFTKIDNYHFDLAIKEEIGDPGLEVRQDFPYLIPTGTSKPYKISPQQAEGLYLSENLFFLNQQDTVFAMRKGTVTNTVQLIEDVNKVAKHTSIEILHVDGTVMVYQQLDSTNNFLELGQTVFPGDPIGVLNRKGILSVELFKIHTNGLLKKQVIQYVTEMESPINYAELPSNGKVIYPNRIKMLEMTEQEKQIYREKN